VVCAREIQSPAADLHVCVRLCMLTCNCGIQARETDLRKLLENAKKDAEAEVKAIQDKFELETKSVSRNLNELNEQIAKAKDDTK
jgi:hypothetical protein